MANWWQIQRLKRGTAHWNEWRIQHPKKYPDLGKADISGYNLSQTNLSNTYLGHALLKLANLSGSHLHWASLMGADLSGANLVGTYLCDVDLSGADLSHADLSGADLSGAILRSANLKKTNLDQTTFSRTIIAKIDLRTTRGLAGIVHRDPSDIEVFSTQLPQDGSAFHFLRGVGVPDEWIEAYSSSTVRPIQYHSCFISYSHEDSMVAQRLHADLQDHGIRCWFAPEDMKIGNKIRDRIDQAIHLQDRSLLLLSEHSIASTWVENEVEAILEKEDRQKREVLFPVRVDEAVMKTSKAWAATLRRTRHIGDFCDWTNPQAYQIAFERLLRDLKKTI